MNYWETLPTDSTLRSCGEAGFAALSEHWVESSCAARTPLLNADDRGTDVYFILSGHVRATTYAPSGREVVFFELASGEAFGLISALRGGARTTNVVAVTECRIARLSAARFAAVLDGNNQVMHAFLVYLAGWARMLCIRMAAISTLNARQRLVAKLLSLSIPDPANGNGGRIVGLPTQQDLASRISSHRETVGRDLSRLASEGLVERRGRLLLLHDVAGLRSLLSSE
jgi:CRP-like cAMP-binding protein